jgi:hypothetical protein
MKARMTSGAFAAGLLALGTVAFAQAASQEPQQPPPGARTSAGGQITVTGCVQREADYRKAQDAGRGGAAGTGVGTGNEFILADASASPSTKAGTEPSSPTGTSGSASSAYELTGPNEGQAAQFVGQRVEITGMLKAAEVAASGQPTGGATAGQPPAGTDVMSKDLRLREIEVSSIKQTTGTCPAVK